MSQHDTLTRFSRDMGGSMEPDENGSWVRFEDAQAAISATQPAQASPRLIGWRTDDYLMETSDKAKAENWAPHLTILPIFEGDPHTKLQASAAQPAQAAQLDAASEAFSAMAAGVPVDAGWVKAQAAQGAGEVVSDYYPELLIARSAVQELEQKVFSLEQCKAILQASVASYQRDMLDPPAYLQDAVIKAAGLGAMAEQIAALKKQVGITQPAAGADVVPEHVALLNEKVQELEARDAFEAQNKCSYGFKRSARGTYVNPPVARDWKWFQLGIQHANKDAS